MNNYHLFVRLASKKVTVVLFSFAGMLCGASYAYQTAIISTMEKQYKFSNRKIGAFIALIEIASILGSFFVPYFASVQGHLPRWSAAGMKTDDLSKIKNEDFDLISFKDYSSTLWHFLLMACPISFMVQDEMLFLILWNMNRFLNLMI
jgi:hypothetical protein